jgi:glycosyltransferase involved in cell wall biosynthesis
MDIGVMPLEADDWSEGKCGFKLIQYLSLGIPAIASPVGVNKQIIENEVTGFLVNTPAEWKQALHALITDMQLRQRMGTAGCTKIVNAYSIQSQREKFIGLFS